MKNPCLSLNAKPKTLASSIPEPWTLVRSRKLQANVPFPLLHGNPPSGEQVSTIYVLDEREFPQLCEWPQLRCSHPLRLPCLGRRTSARGSSLPFSLTRRSCPSSLPPSSKGFPGISTGATADEARHSSGQTALLVGSSYPHLDEGLHGLHHLTQQNRSFQTRLSAFQSNRISSFFQEH